MDAVLGAFLFCLACLSTFSGGVLMVLRKFMGIFAITLIVCSTSLAMAGIPDASQCESIRREAGPKAILLVVPGSAADHSFETSVAIGETPGDPQVNIDATIEVTVRDGQGVVIANYPAEDIWIECPSAPNPVGDPDTSVGLVACIGGAVADQSTDVDGYTEFNNPPFAGGQSWGQTRVVINGNGLSNTVDVSYNSPDIDGDGVVNLIDLQPFAADYIDTGVYHYRSDLFYDGVVNLIDVREMAQYYSSICP
jgi:hypothetical protein